MCGIASTLFTLFYSSIFLSLTPIAYCFIQALISSRINPLMILFFPDDFAIPSYLHFQRNFTLILSVSSRRLDGILFKISLFLF